MATLFDLTGLVEQTPQEEEEVGLSGRLDQSSRKEIICCNLTALFALTPLSKFDFDFPWQCVNDM